MKMRLAWFSLLSLLCFSLANPPAAAQQTLYENGPINGDTNGWAINHGFFVDDSFTISGGASTVNGMSFGAWLTPGDILQTVELSITSQPGAGTVYFDQVVPVIQSGCFENSYSFNVCTETTGFDGPALNNGTYYVNLANAVATNGDPVYWDENSGAGCHSQGCPSLAFPGGFFESIPSESFTILGTTQTGSTPEPSGLVLFSSGVVGVIGFLKRKLL
jgi:hypothetical protein